MTQKQTLPAMLVILLMWISRPAYPQIPTFSAGRVLTFSNGSELQLMQADFIAVPCVADWNGDGNRDLVVGYFTGGPVYVYTNVGSNSQPVFIQGNEEKLQADGSDIRVAYG